MLAPLRVRPQPGCTLQQQHRACPCYKHQRGTHIKAAWGSGTSGNTGTDRWWSSTSQDSSSTKPQEQEQSQDNSGGDRWSHLVNRNPGSPSYGSNGGSSSSSSGYRSGSYAYGSSGSSSYGSSYGSTYGASSSSSQPDSAAKEGSSSDATPVVSSSSAAQSGNAAPWVMLALIPTVLWCITWCFTGGMVTLANTSMSGMCSMARLLFPELPVKGVDYEDVAVSLVKALHSNTDAPSTWTRPGLLAPAWLLRGLMAAMFNLAHASSGVAALLIPSQQVLTVSGVSQGLMYAACLLLMMPLGAGLRALAVQLLALAQKNKLKLPSIKLPFSLQTFNDNTYLALKLAGVLAWPCISVAAVLQPSVMAQNSFNASFTVAALQVGICTLLLVLLLSVAVSASRFAAKLARRKATTEAVLAFGFEVGGLCAAAGLLNMAQIGLGLASGLLAPLQLVVPVVSTLILVRVVWSVWRLHRIGDATPSIWLQLLTLTPGLQLPAVKSSSSSGGGGGSSSN